MADQIKHDLELLLRRFNERDVAAFSEIYIIVHRELHYFTTQLYRDTSYIANDIIHDIFIGLWQKRSLKFETIQNVKAYMYVSVKNRYKSDVTHKKYIHKYNHEVLSNQNSFISNIVESETLSIITQAIDILPSECARVFKMHLEGWDVKEIAQQLGKSQSTVYNQRQEAISILKKKLNKHNFSILVPFF